MSEKESSRHAPTLPVAVPQLTVPPHMRPRPDHIGVDDLVVLATDYAALQHALICANTEIFNLRHDIERQVGIANQYVNDAERMDWLEQRCDYVEVNGSGADDKWMTLGHHDGNRAEGATLREAIDAARKPCAR